MAATKSVSELIGALENTPFAEPPGRWMPCDFWVCEGDDTEIVERMGRMSFEKYEENTLKRCMQTSMQKDTYCDASAGICDMDVDMEIHESGEQKDTDSEEYSYSDDDDVIEEEERGHGSGLTSQRVSSRSLHITEEMRRFQDASIKGYADGVKKQQADSAELDAELAYSVCGDLVELSNMVPGVSEETLHSIRETQQKFPDTGVIRVLVPDEHEIRKAKTFCAKMRADQFVPGDKCYYCDISHNIGGLSVDGNKILAAKIAASQQMEQVALKARRLLLQDYSSYEKQIEDIYVRYIEVLPLPRNRVRNARPPSAMTNYHFFHIDGCTSDIDLVVSDVFQNTASVHKKLRHHIMEQPVHMGGVAIGPPVLNLRNHAAQTKTSELLIKLSKELRDIRKDTPSHSPGMLMPSSLLTAQQKASSSLSKPSGIAMLSTSSRV